MRTTQVYPGITGKGFDSLGQGMDSGWISHGLAILAACAKAEGFAVDLLDLRAMRGWDHFREELLARQPDVVGVSMMSVDYDPARQCLELARQVLPEAVTLVGGPHPTLMLDEVKDAPYIDHIFLGEAEITFPELLARQRRGEPSERILPPVRPELDDLPFADHDFFLEEWRKWGYDLDSPEAPFVPELPPPFVTIIAARGCIYNCSYCQPAERIIFGRKVRQRSVSNVIAELQELQARYHFSSFMFHDDCLTEDREWVIEFCDKIIRLKLKITFMIRCRPDLIINQENIRMILKISKI